MQNCCLWTVIAIIIISGLAIASVTMLVWVLVRLVFLIGRGTEIGTTPPQQNSPMTSLMNDDGLCPECCEYIGNDEWVDCPACGAILIEPDIGACPDCGNELEEDSIVCLHCE